MFKRTIIGTVVSCLASVALVFSMPGTAQAADSTVWLDPIGPHGLYEPGYMMHFDRDDIFYVWDTYPDGHGVLGTLYSAGSVVAAKYNGRGADRYETFAYNVREGVKYVMRVCLVDGAHDTTPSGCKYKDLYE